MKPIYNRERLGNPFDNLTDSVLLSRVRHKWVAGRIDMGCDRWDMRLAVFVALLVVVGLAGVTWTPGLHAQVAASTPLHHVDQGGTSDSHPSAATKRNITVLGAASYPSPTPISASLAEADPALKGSPNFVPVQGPGRCLNPHPGQFRFWNGQQNGCLIQVWRQWPDGCTHFEWFNTCSQVWDPQIYWTFCVH
jgi:hypothetical protein